MVLTKLLLMVCVCAHTCEPWSIVMLSSQTHRSKQEKLDLHISQTFIFQRCLICFTVLGFQWHCSRQKGSVRHLLQLMGSLNVFTAVFRAWAPPIVTDRWSYCVRPWEVQQHLQPFSYSKMWRRGNYFHVYWNCICGSFWMVCCQVPFTKTSIQDMDTPLNTITFCMELAWFQTSETSSTSSCCFACLVFPIDSNGSQWQLFSCLEKQFISQSLGLRLRKYGWDWCSYIYRLF